MYLFSPPVEIAITHSWAVINIFSINECFMPQSLMTSTTTMQREGTKKANGRRKV